MANKPEVVFKLGDVQVAVFSNQGRYGEFYTISPSRSWQEDGTWKSSTVFDARSAVLLKELIARALDHIQGEMVRRGESDAAEPRKPTTGRTVKVDREAGRSRVFDELEYIDDPDRPF